MADSSGRLYNEMIAQLASSKLKERFGVNFNAETSLWEIGFSKLSNDEVLELILAGMESLSSNLAKKWKMVNTSRTGLPAIQFAGLSDIEAREVCRTVAMRFHPTENEA